MTVSFACACAGNDPPRAERNGPGGRQKSGGVIISNSIALIHPDPLTTRVADTTWPPKYIYLANPGVTTIMCRPPFAAAQCVVAHWSSNLEINLAQVGTAVAAAVVLLHSPLTTAGVSMGMERRSQHLTVPIVTLPSRTTQRIALDSQRGENTRKSQRL